MDWSTSLCNFSIAGTLSLSINTINNDGATTSTSLRPSTITCPKTCSIAVEPDLELLHIAITIVDNARISSNHRSKEYVEDDVTLTSRALACDASIPTRSVVNHAGDIIGDNSLSGTELAAPGQAASCLSSLEMPHHHEESSIQETRQDPEQLVVHTETRIPASNKGQLVWDLVRDNDVLREFYRDRRNLVLDSICPEYTPHVVVTPAEEAWNDDLIPWQNRVDFQEAGYLMVPPCMMFPDCCPPVGGQLSHAAPADGPQTAADIIPMLPDGPKTVFSPSVFKDHIEDTSVERLVLHQIVRTLQKQRCKAAFFEASKFAIRYRKRYDPSPNCFHVIERPYVWSDPAEPILLSSNGLLGTTIIDSHSPFSVPHIIINAPPPDDPWVAWNNATNNPQDHGYGKFLIVPSPSVGIINTNVEYWEADYLSDSFSPGQIDLTVDPSESSRPGTPMPGTPMDDDVDYDYYDIYQVRPEADIDGDMYSFDNVAPISYACAPLPYVRDPPPAPRKIFTIEEDEDDLPPFDDWYKQ